MTSFRRYLDWSIFDRMQVEARAMEKDEAMQIR